MRITLIALPNETMTDQRIAPPLGLLYIAAYLMKHGRNQVEVSHLRPPTLNSDIYGVSIASTQLAHAVERCRHIKECYPNALLVIGGPHVTTLPEETLDATGADIAVCGEGERAMLEIVCGLRNQIVTRPYITNIDDIPFPARELLDFSEYTRTIGGRPATNIITSRGCPARCVFCDQDVWGNRLRMHSSAYVLAEVDNIKARTGIDRLLFLDDTLTVNRVRILKIAEGLRQRGVIWRGWTRANCIDLELAREMKRCGCHSLCIGVESGSDQILRNINKGTTVEQNRMAIRAIKDAGMYCRVSIMVGSPGETISTIAETRDFMAETMPDDWIVSTFVPVVGSPAWKDPGSHGIRITETDYSRYYVVGYDQQSGLVHEQDSISTDDLVRERAILIAYLEDNVPRKPDEVVR